MRVEQRAPTDPLWSMVHAPLRSLAFKASNVPVGVGENGGERRVGSMGRAAGKAALAQSPNREENTAFDGRTGRVDPTVQYDRAEHGVVDRFIA